MDGRVDEPTEEGKNHQVPEERQTEHEPELDIHSMTSFSEVKDTLSRQTEKRTILQGLHFLITRMILTEDFMFSA